MGVAQHSSYWCDQYGSKNFNRGWGWEQVGVGVALGILSYWCRWCGSINLAICLGVGVALGTVLLVWAVWER